MLYLLDTETTGFKDPHAYEIAFLPVIINPENQAGNTIASASGLNCQRFNPMKKIDAGASAVTGVYDKDVAHLPPHTNFRLPDDCTHLICHNMSYDAQVLINAGVDLSNIKLMCSVKMARKVFPDSKAKLTSLIEYLCPNTHEKLNANAHGANTDVCLVLIILNKMAKITQWQSIEQLEQWYLSVIGDFEIIKPSTYTPKGPTEISTGLINGIPASIVAKAKQLKEYYVNNKKQLPDIMPFGQHKGTPIQDLPESYCQFLYGQPWMKTDLRDAFYIALKIY